ncbi:MAG: NADH-quinone oxidoreductase subunit H [Acidobacteria bacterium]|nr:NADH-quinone oxidoreductase subunit H [Acidobacteriota bacterium]
MSAGPLLALSGISLLAALLAAWRAPRIWLAATLSGSLAALAGSVRVLATGAGWDWPTTVPLGGETLHLRMDSLSAFFLALLAVLGGAGALYSLGYWTDREHPISAPRGRVWWALLTSGMGFVLLSANGLHFLIAWELFTISSYFLITSERQRTGARSAGWLYLAASHAATLCLFAFFASLAAATGSWELGPLRDQPSLAPLFWLALFGFGVKAGLFPLHIWLPSAHASAPSHVSAILSGMALKMGVYGLYRFTGWLPLPDGAGWVVAALGTVSALLGVAFALGQHDIKRLLAYHSVENIGIILMGLGFSMIAVTHGQPAWGRLALAGGLLHVWNHGLFKSLLFFGAGSVIHATGERTMSRLGGLWRAMPWTAGLFALGAAAIAGLPPLNGFISEYLVFLGLFDAASARGPAFWAAVPAAVMLAMTGALALACFVKVCGIVFLGAPRTDAARTAHEAGWLMRAPMLALGAACAAIGLFPSFFWPAVARASIDWRPDGAPGVPPAPLGTLGALNLCVGALSIVAIGGLWLRVKANGLHRGPTWDCGYASPTARMQYTAGSFAGIITGWFSGILRPQTTARKVEGLFPAEAGLESRTPETVLEYVVEPAGSLVMRAAGAVRRLQHGRIQAYILYLLLGVAALALLATLGGKP